MEQKGYITYKEINHTKSVIDLYVHDLIFVRKEIVDALIQNDKERKMPDRT